MTKIIHIDMDCFYAAVEIRDNPALNGKPVAVGGAANQRGVLTTCNYQARKFGLHSAMSSARALQLCPQLILLPVAMNKYRDVSSKIHDVFARYSDKIEPLSLDEAFLDVSETTFCQGSATRLAMLIRQEIYKAVKLTASAGVAPNKFLAKVASDWRKPNGQFVIAPQDIDAFIKTLAVKKIPGVGKVTAKKMLGLGVERCEQLQSFSKETLEENFGKLGIRLYDFCRGIDHRPVQSSRVRKSLSVEHTYLNDLTTFDDCEMKLDALYPELVKRLKKHRHRFVRVQFIKIKFSDFTQTTRQCVVAELSEKVFQDLLHESLRSAKKAIRLLGVGVQFHDEQVKLVQSQLL